MQYIIKSRSLTFALVATVMLLLTACDIAHASYLLSPEVLMSAVALPFMVGDTANIGDIGYAEKAGENFRGVQIRK